MSAAPAAVQGRVGCGQRQLPDGLQSGLIKGYLLRVPPIADSALRSLVSGTQIDGD
jgi:hypothetical protein